MSVSYAVSFLKLTSSEGVEKYIFGVLDSESVLIHLSFKHLSFKQLLSLPCQLRTNIAFESTQLA